MAHFHEIKPMLISEADMAADIYTKYLVFKVWRRHADYLLNVNNGVATGGV